jgi:hypothetical protein
VFEQDSHSRKIAADIAGATAGAGTATALAPAVGPVVAAGAGAAVAYGVRETVKDDEKLVKIAITTNQTFTLPLVVTKEAIKFLWSKR